MKVDAIYNALVSKKTMSVLAKICDKKYRTSSQGDQNVLGIHFMTTDGFNVCVFGLIKDNSRSLDPILKA